VVIEVGQMQTKYTVQKDLLTHYSKYFTNALSGKWQEADGIIILDDIETSVFNLFINWMYTQTLALSPHEWFNNAEVSTPTNDDIKAAKVLHIKLYVFADRFEVASLCKILLHHLQCHQSDFLTPSAGVVAYAFGNLPAKDPVLDVFVAWYCANWNPKNYTKEEMDEWQQLPSDFTFRCLQRYVVMVRSYSGWGDGSGWGDD
jgi:hypothetical protein